MTLAIEAAAKVGRQTTTNRLVSIVAKSWPVADVFFVGILLALLTASWALLTKSPYPAGIDPGNWLAFGHAIGGEHIRSSSIVYPPVVPLAALAATTVFGPFLGIQVLAEAASAVPAAAAYLVLRGSVGGWRAAILASFLAAASSTYEAMAWGGYPQLIGLGLLLIYLWLFDGYLRTGRKLHALLAGVILALTLSTSDIIGVAAVVTGAVLLVGHLVLRKNEIPGALRLGIGLGFVALPCLPLIPLYLQLGGSVVESFHARRADAFVSAAALRPAADTMFRDFPVFWRTATLLAAALPLALIGLRRTTLWLLSTSLLIATAILVLGLREFRFLYLLPPAAVLGLACWLQYFRQSMLRSVRWAGVGASLLLLLSLYFQSLLGLQSLRVSLLPFYTFLNGGLVSGIEWVHNHTPSDATIAVSPTRGDYPLGWWMEGLARRKTLYASNPTWLNFADERNRAAKASQIFDPSLPLGLAIERARRFGVTYVLIDKTWMGNGLWAPGAASLEAVEIVLDNESVLLFKVR